MSPSFNDSSCPFCGVSAQTTKISHGDRDVFLCSNSECGDSEISRTAMKRIKDSFDIRSEYQGKVKLCKADNKVLEITVSSNNELQSACIERR